MTTTVSGMTIVALHGIQEIEPRGLLFPGTPRTNPNPKQFGKASAPIDVTDTGKCTLSRLGHDAKQLPPMVTTESDTVINAKAGQEEKAFAPRLVTASPICTDVNWTLDSKVND